MHNHMLMKKSKKQPRRMPGMPGMPGMLGLSLACRFSEKVRFLADVLIVTEGGGVVLFSLRGCFCARSFVLILKLIIWRRRRGRLEDDKEEAEEDAAACRLAGVVASSFRQT